jgi:hypothetical protein
MSRLAAGRFPRPSFRREALSTRPSECFGFRCQSSALRVGEPDTSGPELFPHHPVFFLKIIDDVALLLVHPTGERDENEPQRVRQRGHRVKATRGSVHRLRGAR